MIHTKIMFIFTALLFSSSLFSNDTALKTKIEQLPMIKNINAKVTKVVTHKNLYHFKAEVMGNRPGKLEGFLTKDLTNLIIGKAYTTQTAQQFTIPFDLDIKALKEIAAYKLGNGADEYFLFTDPECPYCHKLEKRLSSLKDNATVYVVLFPLSFHKNAKSMCRYILNQKDDASKAQAMKEIANKSTKFMHASYNKMELNILNAKIQNSLNAVNKIGINGTPAILNSQGIQVQDRVILK